MDLDLAAMPANSEALRAEVRAFLREAGRDWTAATRARSWMGFDRAFSRQVAARGWIGMSWPRRYGGQERSALERFIVIEEMLAAGAPVGAHWIADRQSGPLLLRYGTEAQRQALLPRIAAGELAFCIGLSEPGSGSDLASLTTRAEREPGGWRISGRKLWTTFAHLSDFMIALVRTSAPGQGAPRHGGLSQFLIDLRLPGIGIRPIRDLSGEESFNEVTFDGVLVPEDALLGREGEGWSQATSELAFERSGPDRYLSSIAALEAGTDAAAALGSDHAEEQVGRMLSRLWALRGMSQSVVCKLEQGLSPAVEAALVKDVGNAFEQALPEAMRAILPAEDPAPGLAAILQELELIAPTFSLRGGTREILRGVIARDLGLR